MKTLTLVRGLPGSGKTTWAKNQLLWSEFSHGMFHIEADTYHIRDGKYEWKPENVAKAHEWCRMHVQMEMIKGTPNIFVSNTFTTIREMVPYDKLAQEFGYRLIEVSLFDGGFSDEELFKRNVHSVPLETIKKMRERWER